MHLLHFPSKEFPQYASLLRHLWLFLSPHPRWMLNGPFTPLLSAFCQLFYSWFSYSQEKSMLLIGRLLHLEPFLFLKSNCLFSFIFNSFFIYIKGSYFWSYLITFMFLSEEKVGHLMAFHLIGLFLSVNKNFSCWITLNTFALCLHFEYNIAIYFSGFQFKNSRTT